MRPSRVAIAGAVAGAVTLAAATACSPASADIVVDQSETHQTMLGWEALQEIGQDECDPAAYLMWRDQVHDRAANELGINRIRLSLRNGLAENPVDHYARFRGGEITFDEWKRHWFTPINDNADPLVADTARFHWGHVDNSVREVVLPLRDRLRARGRGLYVMLAVSNYNVKGPFQSKDDPEEYAEVVVEAFRHLEAEFGLVPDGLELINEPDLHDWTGTEVGRAAVVMRRRLHDAGFEPHIIAPSASTPQATVVFFDEMARVPGAVEAITDLGFHRYGGPEARSVLPGIASRAARFGLRTVMTEHSGGDYLELHEDLKVVGVSAWEQFGLAFCGDRDSGGIYFPVYGGAAGASARGRPRPEVRLSATARFLGQYFRRVELHAVRIGAATDNAALDPVAFRNPWGGVVVVVKADGRGRVTVRGLPTATYGVEYTTEREHAASAPDVAPDAAGAITTDIPARGVLTIFARR